MGSGKTKKRKSGKAEKRKIRAMCAEGLIFRFSAFSLFRFFPGYHAA